MSEGCCQAAAVTDTVTALIYTLVQQEKHDLLAKPSVLLLWSHVGVTSVGVQPQRGCTFQGKGVWIRNVRKQTNKQTEIQKKKRQRSRAGSTTQ